MRSSSRLSGTERANRRWLSEKIRSSRTSISASSSPSSSMARSAAAPTLPHLGHAHVACCGVI